MKIDRDIKEKSPPTLGDDPLVIRTRFERVTVCLEGRCSIQLSYRTIFHAAYVVRLRFASAKLKNFFEVSKSK